MTKRVPPTVALAAIVLAALAGAAWGQMDYPAEIRKTAALLKENPASQTNRVRLATLYSLHGAQQARSGKPAAAIEAYRAGLSVVEERGREISRTTPVFQALWYGLGFSYRAAGQPGRAVTALEPLVSTFPRLLKGRYLLGVCLVESGTPANIPRGIEVLTQLATDDPGAVGQMARRAALRWAYNFGTVLASQGKAADAARTLLSLNRTGSADGAATAQEQQHLLYGAGYFKLHGGDTPAGIADLEVLKDLNPDYKLRNGIGLRAVLANAYYQGGLEQVSDTGVEALKLAAEFFDLSEQTGNPKAADVNYGKALAYLKMGKGQEGNVARELESMVRKDPEFYRRLNPTR